ncbi:MAG: hypothetical protein IJ165_07290 [Proteobacteria bacterium]|nr:hypothetical protein [Pseudomonadota bacterium]
MAGNNEVETYDFRYECDGHEIDLRTLLYSQEYYLGLLHEINRELFPNQQLSIRVAAIEPGSFVVSQVVEIAVAVGNVLFSVGPLSDIFKAIGALFQIRDIIARHNGEKPRESPKQITNVTNNGTIINNLTLTFSNGDSHDVSERLFNSYKTNKKVDECMRGMSDVISNDSRIRCVAVAKKGEVQPIWYANRDDLDVSKSINPYMESDEPEAMTESECESIVTVLKPDLSDSTTNKWEIRKDGKILKGVEMLDTAFKTRIKSKEFRFGYEDEMRVRMRITSVWSEKKGRYEEKKQEILEVLKFPVPKPIQTEMQF